MRGIKENNFPAFHAAAAQLRAKGNIVFNPAENDEWFKRIGIEVSTRNCFEADMAWICRYADRVELLYGWEKSKGAQAEKALAEALGLKVTYANV
jgi:hypothetical protein